MQVPMLGILDIRTYGNAENAPSGALLRSARAKKLAIRSDSSDKGSAGTPPGRKSASRGPDFGQKARSAVGTPWGWGREIRRFPAYGQDWRGFSAISP
jgi:hypothetical protein